MAKEPPRFVLLCRHARHEDGRLLAVKGADDCWRYPTDAVARALLEELVIGSDQLRLAKVVYAPTPEASRTAGLLLKRLRGGTTVAQPEPPRQPAPGPDGASSTIARPRWLPSSETTGGYGYSVVQEEWAELLPGRLHRTKVEAYGKIRRALDGLPADRNALLVVGHQPQMSWLSSYLSRRAIPLTSSEVACLRLRKGWFGWRGSLAWTLAPDDRAAFEAVTDKVRSKMESAKLLSAVITLVLTALLTVVLDTTRWGLLKDAEASLGGLSYNGQFAVQAAFGLLLAALALYLATMYAYDGLLMPTRFWAEKPGRRPRLLRRARTRLPRRPPSSAAWIVLRNMQVIWFGLFTTANVLVALALLVLGGALLRMDDDWIIIPAGASVAAVIWWFWPALGSED